MKLIPLAFASLVLLAAEPAAALTVGSNSTGNSFPFSNSDISRYQLVYDTDVFAGEMSIGEVSFQLTSGTFLPTVDVAVSWHILATDYLASNTVLDDNLGTELADWGLRRMNGESVSGSLALTGDAFDYDPADGHLVLDLVFTGYLGSGNTTFAADTSTGDLYRNYVFNGSVSRNTVGGLVSTFAAGDVTTSPVPLPAAGLLLAGGLGALGLMRRRAA